MHQSSLISSRHVELNEYIPNAARPALFIEEFDQGDLEFHPSAPVITHCWDCANHHELLSEHAVREACSFCQDIEAWERASMGYK